MLSRVTAFKDRTNPSLLAIVAEGFLSRLSFGLLSFALPLFARHVGMSLSQIGLLASLNMIVAVAFKPLMGRAADRFGLKPSLAASIGMRSAVSLLFVFAAAPWQLFSVRSIHGLSISLRDPAVNALIAEQGGKGKIASSFAWYQTAKSLAGSLGKMAAGLLLTLTAFNFSMVFLIAFVLSGLPIIAVLRYVSSDPVNHPSAERRARRRRGDEPAPLRESLPFASLAFSINGTAYMIGSLFPVLATEYAGLSAAQAGSIYGLTSLVTLSGPAFGWLADHASHKLVLAVRSVANTIASLIFLFVPNLAGFAVGRSVDEVGKAAFRPAWGALMAIVSEQHRKTRARMMGYMTMGEDGGEIVGPIVAGFLWSTWGAPALLLTRAVFAVATEVFALRLMRRLDIRSSPTKRRRGRPSAYRSVGRT